MKLKLIIFSLFIVIMGSVHSEVNAQETKLALNFGPDALIPITQTAATNDLSLGGSLQVMYSLKPKLYITATAAYFKVKTAQLYKDLWEPWDYTFSDPSFVPVKAGLRYDLFPKLFLAADAGASLPLDSTRSTSFAYSASLGTDLRLSNNLGIQLSVRYENWALNLNSYSNFIGVRAAFALPIIKR
ncbi:MAG: hypothetical protein EOO99_06820 [Pedobacter sp.]|nr:MAG: hypothetical protein EOO99_06820 [Pedobacter sp.]